MSPRASPGSRADAMDNSVLAFSEAASWHGFGVDPTSLLPRYGATRPVRSVARAPESHAPGWGWCSMTPFRQIEANRRSALKDLFDYRSRQNSVASAKPSVRGRLAEALEDAQDCQAFGANLRSGQGNRTESLEGINAEFGRSLTDVTPLHFDIRECTKDGRSGTKAWMRQKAWSVSRDWGPVEPPR